MIVWQTKASSAATEVAAHLSPDDEVLILCPRDEALWSQLNVFVRALTIYEQRNKVYKDNWRRMGQRGVLIRIRERAERLWDHLWPRPPALAANTHYVTSQDDALDLINFAAFLIRAIHDGEATHGGSWWEEDER